MNHNNVKQLRRQATKFENMGMWPVLHESYRRANNTSEIQPTRHSTDTHGANQVNFLILYTFGHAFAPRYKGLHRKTAGLVGFDSPSQYPETMLIRPAKKSDEDLIIREWPNVQRILASLAQKETTQATIVRKLSSYARQNQTQKAMWELDNILRSMYVLDFIDDVELRKGVYKALNRGKPSIGFEGQSALHTAASSRCKPRASSNSGTNVRG
ncbi:MAG: Tn3 family transposase [Polaromonas sp.]|nr:Tn3 family transposase [Polaromonas sp.]